MTEHIEHWMGIIAPILIDYRMVKITVADPEQQEPEKIFYLRYAPYSPQDVLGWKYMHHDSTPGSRHTGLDTLLGNILFLNPGEIISAEPLEHSRRQ